MIQREKKINILGRIYEKRGEREREELAFGEREERKLVKSFLEREKKYYREIEQRNYRER